MNTRANFVSHPCPRRSPQSALSDYYAQMAVDCMNTLAVFQGPGGLWREHEVTGEVHRALGPRPRRCCVLGVAVRAARAVAQRDGLPWPTLEETIDQSINGKTHL